VGAREPHKFPRRISLRHQSLDWTSAFREYRGRIRQHLVCFRPLFSSLLAGLPVAQ